MENLEGNGDVWNVNGKVIVVFGNGVGIGGLIRSAQF